MGDVGRGAGCGASESLGEGHTVQEPTRLGPDMTSGTRACLGCGQRG